jgi:hypothetical protein
VVGAGVSLPVFTGWRKLGMTRGLTPHRYLVKENPFSILGLGIKPQNEKEFSHDGSDYEIGWLLGNAVLHGGR